MGTVYTAADCLNTAINLGNHTAADDAVTLEHRNFADIDGRMLMAEKLVTGADLGYVGEIKEVNPEPLNNALASGYIPIVSTVAGGYDGNVYNINADIAASQIAAKIGAKKLEQN